MIECELPSFHGPDIEGASSPLRLRLGHAALTELFDHAEQDFRLYELWSIRRPGDVYGYVSVQLLSDKQTLSARTSYGLDDDSEVVRDLCSGRAVSLLAFEDLLGDEGEDESTGARQWMLWRQAPNFRNYLKQLLVTAREVLDRRATESVIAEHVVRRIELQDHGLCYVRQAKAIAVSGSHKPTPRYVSDDFLRRLQESLKEVGVRSVVMAADFIESSVVRIVCAEQRSRVDHSGLPPSEALKVCAFVEHETDVPSEWGAEVRIQWEGIPRGDLWIILWRDGDSPKYQWVKGRPYRLVLCATDYGEVAGFVRANGQGWTLYRKEERASGLLEAVKSRDDKAGSYVDLVRERKRCARCAGLTNPSSPCLRRFDGPEIGPWTRWQRDLNAQVMVVGQDWGGSIAYLKQEGVDADSPTNQNLRKLLGTRGYIVQPPRTGPTSPQVDGAVFLTNSVLCIKQGADSGTLRAAWVRECGREFLRRQIELIQPSAVVSLGYEAYRAVMWAFDKVPLQNMEAAVATAPRLAINGIREVLLVPNFHCGRLGVLSRSMAQQEDDWRRVPPKLGHG